MSGSPKQQLVGRSTRSGWVSRIRPVGDVAIRPGTVVIGTSAGVVGFRLKPATAAAVGEE